MRIGIVLPIAEEDAATGVPSYAEIRAVAVAAEAAGLDSVWVFDHLLFRFDGETTGIHECWTILAAIAEATSRVELGTIVLCTGFRNAALLAKMAATLDHISGGRLILGIGAGWHDPEFEAFGYPTDHKVGRFEESLAVITGLIRDGPGRPGRPVHDGARRRPAAARPARTCRSSSRPRARGCSSSRPATPTPGTWPGSGCPTSGWRAFGASCGQPASASAATRRP